MQEDEPDSRICQKPLEFLLLKEGQIQRNGEGEGKERRKNKEGVKQSTRPWNLYIFFYFIFCTDYKKVCISKIYVG